MLATYGVEAARKTIVDQVLMVFGAYGIQVREQQEIHSISTRRLLRFFLRVVRGGWIVRMSTVPYVPFKICPILTDTFSTPHLLLCPPPLPFSPSPSSFSRSTRGI